MVVSDSCRGVGNGLVHRYEGYGFHHDDTEAFDMRKVFNLKCHSLHGASAPIMPGHNNSGAVAVDASHCFDDSLGDRQLISTSLARGRESISRLIFSPILAQGSFIQQSLSKHNYLHRMRKLALFRIKTELHLSTCNLIRESRGPEATRASAPSQ